MKKVYFKLVFLTIMLLAALAAVVTVTYAFFILSTDPVMNGITVTLGGGNTILLAPDLQETLDNGQTVHYPGEFSAKLDLNACESYAYLNSVGTLRPVSTADGIHWFLPVYDAETGVLTGFADDSTLQNANLGQGAEGTGRYIYLDLWIVSPGADYVVRVSKDEKSGEGSFLTELPGVVQTETGGMTLGESSGSIASIARVGFLVNGAVASDAAMQSYVSSLTYDGRYRSLTGVYPEPGTDTPTGNFTIYEPNGTLHRGEADGTYLITSPLGVTGEGCEPTGVEDILAVQVPSQWAVRQGQTGTALETELQAALAGKTVTDPAEAEQMLYAGRLQGQVSPLVEAGGFYADTAALYAAAENGAVSPESLEELGLAGAADGAVITRLKANVPQRVRVFIWLEGQDPDAVNSGLVPGERFALSIELAGESE